MKLKAKIKNVKKMTNNIFKQFPITILLVFIATIFFTIFLDTKILSEKIFEHILMFLVLFGCGTLFTESFFKKKSIKKYISYFCFLAISILLTILQYKTSIEFNYLDRICIVYALVLFISSFYQIYENSNKEPSEYLIKVFSNILIISIIYSFLSGGILVLTSIFTTLFMPNSTSLIVRAIILVYGLFYVPSLLISLTNVKKQVSSPIKIIVKNILLPILALAFIIIYIYMFKIIIFWQIPSNKIFGILSLLFIVSVPIWVMVKYYDKEKDILQKINNILPIMFIPFLCLQIYSLIVRIINYGVTPFRYVAILFILLEIIYLILHIRSRKISNILIILNAFIIISLLLPGINMFDVSNNNQLYRIKKIIKKDNINNEEKMKIKSSYSFLKNTKEGEKLLDKNLSKKEKSKIKELYRTSYNIVTYDSIYGEVSSKEVYIEGYNNLTSFSIRNDESTEISFNNIKINNNYYDLENIVNSYIEANNVGDFQEHFEKYHEFELNDNTKIVLYQFDISMSSNVIDYYSLKGYLLTK